MNVLETFYTIDILFGVFVLLFGLAGMMRGLSGELARLLAFIFLLAGFSVFYPSLTQLAASRWSSLSPLAVQVLVGVAVWVSGLVLFFILRVLLKKILNQLIDGPLDRVAGAVFGLLFGALFGLSVLVSVSLIPHESAYRMLSEKTVVGGWVCERLTPWLHPRLMELPVFDHEEN